MGMIPPPPFPGGGGDGDGLVVGGLVVDWLISQLGGWLVGWLVGCGVESR